MEIRQLESFVTITQLHSFSKAGQALGYSQSAISVQIKLLEEELNVRLFDRIGRNVAVTTAGEEFLEYANKILQEVHQAGNFAKQSGSLQNPLHIGTLESICFTKLPPILNHFRQEYPDVKISITTGSPGQLIEMMEKNQLDLIYILDRSRYNNNWHRVYEVKEPIVFVTSIHSKFAERKTVKFAELLDEPFFLTEKNENYRRELDHFCETQGVIIEPFLEISDTEFIIKMIKNNRGISFLPLFSVREAINNRELAVLNVPEFTTELYRQIFYHKNKFATEEMQQFIRLAKLNLT